jgi:hypothetical protein
MRLLQIFKPIFLVFLMLSFTQIACQKQSDQAKQMPDEQKLHLPKEIVLYGGSDQFSQWLHQVEAFVKAIEPVVPPFADLALMGLTSNLAFNNPQSPNFNRPVRFFLINENQAQVQAQDSSDFEPLVLVSFYLKDAKPLDQMLDMNRWQKVEDHYELAIQEKKVSAQLVKDLFILSTSPAGLKQYQDEILKFQEQKYADQLAFHVNLKSFDREINAFKLKYAEEKKKAFQNKSKDLEFFNLVDPYLEKVDELEAFSMLFNVKRSNIQILSSVTVKQEGGLHQEVKKLGVDVKPYLKNIHQNINALFLMSPFKGAKKIIEMAMPSLKINPSSYTKLLNAIDEKSLFLFAENYSQIIGIDLNQSNQNDQLLVQAVDLINQIIINLKTEAEKTDQNPEEFKLTMSESNLAGFDFNHIQLNLSEDTKREIMSAPFYFSMLTSFFTNLSVVHLPTHSFYAFGEQGKNSLEHVLKQKDNHEHQALDFLVKSGKQLLFAFYLNSTIFNPAEKSPSQDHFHILSLIEKNKLIGEMHLSLSFSKSLYQSVKPIISLLTGIPLAPNSVPAPTPTPTPFPTPFPKPNAPLRNQP